MNSIGRFFSQVGHRPVLALAVRAMSGQTYTTLNITKPREHVVRVEMNRPEKRNAMNMAFWSELRTLFQELNKDSDCRAVVITGAGKIFTAGLDIMDFGQNVLGNPNSGDSSRLAFKMRHVVLDLQETFTVIEKCTKPVIAAIHSACVGGGVDMTSACDIRYCSQDAWFQIKEIDIGLAADVGTLQRFPKVIGNDSAARELAYTARPFYAEEAKEIGFVSRILQDRESCIEAALDTASLIASKSPVAVQGTKVNMVYSRDHSVADGLNHVATWNQGMLQSEDIQEAAQAMMQKKEPKFSKL